jgi:hypothetical protein
MPGALIEVHNILWMKYYNQIELFWVGKNAHVIGAPYNNIVKGNHCYCFIQSIFLGLPVRIREELTLHLGCVL